MTERICENCYYYNSFNSHCSETGRWVYKERTCEDGYWGIDDD